MAKPTAAKNPPFTTGQMWQLKDRYVQITGVGKTLVEYKLLRQPGQRVVQSQMGTAKNVTDLLQANQAKLITMPPQAPKR